MRPHLILSLWLISAFAASAQDTKDPYQWLEDVTAEKCLEWAKERNAKTTSELAQGPEFKALDERLHLWPSLESPPARELDQLDRTAAPVVAQLDDHALQRVRANLAVEQAFQVAQRYRFGGR